MPIVGALIEACFCERFEQLAPLLDDRLCRFYQGLLASEARHFAAYLKLAQHYAEGPIDNRLAHFTEVERELIEAPDSELRFQSGPPTVNSACGGGQGTKGRGPTA